MAELVLNTVLGGHGCSVTTTDDDNLAVLCSLDGSVHGRLCAVGELLKLEDTRGTVPENSLGLANGLLEELDGLLTAVETHPSVGDTLLVGGRRCFGVFVELVGGNVINGKNNLDVVLLGLLNKVLDGLAASLVEEGVSDLDVLESLLEGESHATTDDEAVHLAEQIVDELDLVRNLGTTEDGKEWSLRVLEGLGKVFELLLDEEARGLLGEVNTDHGAVSAVGGSESIVCSCKLVSLVVCLLFNAHTDEDVTESGETLPKLLDISLVGLDLLALGVLAASLLFGVESQVLEQHNAAVGGRVDGLLNLGTDTVAGEGDLLAQELLELSGDRLERVLWIGLAIRTAKVGHENNGLCAILGSILDGGESANNPLVVGDLASVKGDVEVDLTVVSELFCCLLDRTIVFDK